MLPKKVRFVLSVENTPLAVRVVPHKTNDKKLVLKSGHPEAAGALMQLGGMTPKEAIRGSSFFVTEVDRKEFLLAMPTIVGKILDANAKILEATPLLQLTDGPEDEEDEDGEEEGGDDEDVDEDDE